MFFQTKERSDELKNTRKKSHFFKNIVYQKVTWTQNRFNITSVAVIIVIKQMCCCLSMGSTIPN